MSLTFTDKSKPCKTCGAQIAFYQSKRTGKWCVVDASPFADGSGYGEHNKLQFHRCGERWEGSWKCKVDAEGRRASHYFDAKSGEEMPSLAKGWETYPQYVTDPSLESETAREAREDLEDAQSFGWDSHKEFMKHVRKVNNAWNAEGNDPKDLPDELLHNPEKKA